MDTKERLKALSEYNDVVNENARLKELNREMVEAIKLNCKTCGDYRCETCTFYKVLAKAEEEVPPGIVVGYNFKKMKECEGE